MDVARNIGISLIALSLAVVGVGIFFIHYYSEKQEPLVILDTDWNVIEETVDKDIGSSGYQFLSSGSDIPAVSLDDYERCYQNYAEVKTVGPEYIREYLFKYNQIVRLRLQRAGINCSQE